MTPNEEPLIRPAEEFRDSEAFFATMSVLFVVLAVLISEPVTAVLLCALAGKAALSALRPRTRLRVTDAGVEIGHFIRPPGLVAWTDVRDVREGSWGVVELELKDPGAFRRSLSFADRVIARANRIMYGFGPTGVSPRMLDRPKRDVLESLEAALDAYTLAEEGEDRSLPSPDDPVDDGDAE